LNLLDENFPQDQRFLLRDWHVSFRQIGCEIAAAGIQDLEIIPPVHRLGRVTRPAHQRVAWVDEQ
jgi:hypothetical protein